MKGGRIPLVVGGTVVGTLALLALVTPWLPLADPSSQNLAMQYARPSSLHPLGLGENGVDLLSRVLWSLRLSFAVAFGSVLVSAFIGLCLGSIAGYLRGTFDLVLMRIVEVFYAFPGLLLVVALAAVLGPSVRNLVVVLVATSWASYARLMRGISLGLREREFVHSARALGASVPRIVVRHLWPNLVPPLVVQMTSGLVAAILTESSLSFLGLGSPPGVPSWGQMLNEGREVLTSSVHVILVPAGALVATVLGLNLLGDGLRDRLDPRTRS